MNAFTSMSSGKSNSMASRSVTYFFARFSFSSFDEGIFDVFCDEVEGGDEKEDDEGREEDAEAKGDGHRDQESCLHFSFKDHWGKAKEGGEGGQDDRAEARRSSIKNGIR